MQIPVAILMGTLPWCRDHRPEPFRIHGTRRRCQRHLVRGGARLLSGRRLHLDRRRLP